jgi:hypothetical protein
VDVTFTVQGAIIGRIIMLPRRLVGVAVALVLAGGGAHGSR